MEVRLILKLAMLIFMRASFAKIGIKFCHEMKKKVIIIETASMANPSLCPICLIFASRIFQMLVNICENIYRIES